MTVEDYIRMNRGINNDADLPPDYLTAIYDEIKEEPISLKKQAVTTEPTEKANLTDKLKKKLYESEMESIASTAKALMEAVSHVTSEFISTSHSEHVRHKIKIEKYLLCTYHVQIKLLGQSTYVLINSWELGG